MEPTKFSGGLSSAGIPKYLMPSKQPECGRFSPLDAGYVRHDDPCGKAGRSEDARRILEELEQMSEAAYVSPIFFVFAHIGCGELERASEDFEKAYQERTPLATYWPVDWYDKLRPDLGYRNILRRLNLPTVEPKR